METQQNQKFQEAYRKLVYRAEKENLPKPGTTDKLLLKDCLKEVVGTGLEVLISDGQIFRAIEIYSQKYLN